MHADQIALRIMLSPKMNEKEREKKLKAAAKKFQKQLNNEIECPECGDEGPHDDNGAMRRSELTYCCRKCGTHFDAEPT